MNEPTLIDSFALDSAATAGSMAFRVERDRGISRSNPYSHRLLRWAWEIGWRQEEHLAKLQMSFVA